MIAFGNSRRLKRHCRWGFRDHLCRLARTMRRRRGPSRASLDRLNPLKSHVRRRRRSPEYHHPWRRGRPIPGRSLIWLKATGAFHPSPRRVRATAAPPRCHGGRLSVMIRLAETQPHLLCKSKSAQPNRQLLQRNTKAGPVFVAQPQYALADPATSDHDVHIPLDPFPFRLTIACMTEVGRAFGWREQRQSLADTCGQATQ